MPCCKLDWLPRWKQGEVIKVGSYLGNFCKEKDHQWFSQWIHTGRAAASGLDVILTMTFKRAYRKIHENLVTGA